MTTYVKSLSKTKEAEDKEKTLPIAYLGSTMASHGDDFEPDSEFGQCLASTCAPKIQTVDTRLTVHSPR